jgi:hypothetical protein
VFNERIALPEHVGFNASFAWLPDRSGWLVAGNLVDRESKRILLTVRTRGIDDLTLHVLDKDRLLGKFAHDDSRLEVLTIPWDTLRRTLAQMKTKAPAFLRPGQPVSLRVEFANLRGSREEAGQLIYEAVAERLAREGIPIQPDQPTAVRVRLAETAGDRLPIVVKRGPFDIFGTDTGGSAQEAEGEVVVELVTEGRPQPWWREVIQATSGRRFEEAINDQTLRADMLRNLCRQFSDLAMPYYIPESEEYLSLPVIVE